MKIVSDKLCRKTLNTHFMFNIFYENHDVYKIMWKNIVDRARSQMIIWRMRIACWIPKATNTSPEYVLLTDFPLQRRLHEEHLIVTLRVHCMSGLNLCEGFLSTASDHSQNILIRDVSSNRRRKKSTLLEALYIMCSFLCTVKPA